LTGGSATGIMVIDWKLRSVPGCGAVECAFSGESIDVEEGKMMKNTEKAKSFTFCLFALSFVLGALVLWLSGCGYVFRAGRSVDDAATDVLMLGSNEEFAQLGETEAEGRRRHLRNKRLNQQQLMEDIDAFLLLDEPSRLTTRRIR
jgi:hypothetical protein